MTSLNLRKTLSRPLLLLSAAFLLHTNGAGAADREGDAQTQAREVLSGTTAGRSAAAQSSTLPDSDASRPALDPQEQARELILGTQRVGGDAETAAAPYSKATSPAGVIGRGDRRARADAQEMARRVILGKVA
jgi:hypothetical protein